MTRHTAMTGHIAFLPLIMPLIMPLMILLAGCGATKEPVKVISHPVEFSVEHPAEIPLPDMQKAKGLTLWFFHCRPQFTYDSQIDPSGIATITIRGVTMEIGLTIKELLPESPGKDVLAHEEGHADVARRIYADAPAIAGERSRDLIGKQFTGHGSSKEQSIDQAVQAARKALCDGYTAQTANRAEVLSADYDSVTMHGLAKIEPPQAVEQVFREETRHITPSQTIR